MTVMNAVLLALTIIINVIIIMPIRVGASLKITPQFLLAEHIFTVFRHITFKGYTQIEGKYIVSSNYKKTKRVMVGTQEEKDMEEFAKDLLKRIKVYKLSSSLVVPLDKLESSIIVASFYQVLTSILFPIIRTKSKKMVLSGRVEINDTVNSVLSLKGIISVRILDLIISFIKDKMKKLKRKKIKNKIKNQ